MVPQLTLALAAGLFVTAQAQAASLTMKAGQSKKVWTTFNCRTGIFSYGSGTASHGTVDVRPSTKDRCGNQAHPVLDYWYTPKPGFRGQDEVFLYNGSLTGRHVITVR